MALKEFDLCPTCSDLIRASTGTTSHPFYTSYQSSYGSLRSSGKTCGLCHFIASLWPQFKSHLRDYGVSEASIQSSEVGYSVNMTMKSARKMQSSVSWAFWDAVLRTTNTPFSFLSYFTVVACQSGDSASTLPVWSSQSTTFEEKLPIPFAPLRLLTVGLDNKPCRLVERSPTTVQSEYATLSYCWGKSSQLCTTTKTLARFSQEIPLELMPKTFAEAIRICRALQIPHIWIDSLCIVQDNREEWQSGAAIMSEIYQGSQLTITAAQSSDSSQGCFLSDQNTAQSGGLFFRTRQDSSDSPSSIVRVYRGDIRTVATTGGTISTRGWTLQEKLLSLRNVFCMDPDIHWQCQAGYQTQTGILFEPNGAVNNSDVIAIPLRGVQLADGLYRTAWRRIVEGYSVREFTYSNDRIPAIAGLIEYFASTLNDSPILGLWAKSFARDLAWLRGGGTPQLSDVSRLPTWTWLACQGSFFYTIGDTYEDEKDQTGSLKLLNWLIRWDGKSYTSCLEMAIVHVEGSVREIPIRPFTDGNFYMPPYFQVFDEELTPLSEIDIPWRCSGRFDAGDEVAPATHLCLLLFSQTRPSWPENVFETFLILKAVEGHSEGCYTRVGLATIWGRSPTFDPSNTMSMTLV